MASTNNDSYAEVMARSDSEALRLQRQFQFVTRALGWTVHPTIAQRLGDTPAIADIGTGTGAFLLSLASHLPRSRLDGFDVSPAMFPAPDCLPSNVHLHVADAKDPFDPSHHGLYDLVHLRYLVGGLEEPDWKKVLRNVLPLLKPGGAIQWVEPDLRYAFWVRGNTQSTTAWVNMMCNRFKNDTFTRRTSHGWNTLPVLMEDAGLRVEVDVVSSDRLVEDRTPYAEDSMKLLVEAARMMATRGVPDALTQEEIQQAEHGMQQDVKSGAYWRNLVHTTIGFKSENQTECLLRDTLSRRVKALL